MYEGAIGVKTGYTKAAGRCIMCAAERNGRTLIAVTLNDPNDWNDHMELLDAGFAQYEEITLHEAGRRSRCSAFLAGMRIRFRSLRSIR